MQSKEQKLLRLIDSPDKETKDLGELTLVNSLTKRNIIFWYIELEKRKTIGDQLYEKIINILGHGKPPIESIEHMVTFMKNEDIDEKSLSKFFSYYNNYVYGMISGYWPIEKRRNFKKLINVNSTTTESNTDL